MDGCKHFYPNNHLIYSAGRGLKPGKSRVLYGLGKNYSAVAVANLGKQDVGFCPLEQLEEGRENIRAALGGKLFENFPEPPRSFFEYSLYCIGGFLSVTVKLQFLLGKTQNTDH